MVALWPTQAAPSEAVALFATVQDLQNNSPGSPSSPFPFVSSAMRAAFVQTYSGTLGDGYAGTFMWSTADNSAHVTADTQKGIYVPSAADPTGASGAWVRVLNPGDKYYLNWFGIPSIGDASTALQNAINAIPDGSRIGVIGLPTWNLANSLLLNGRTSLIIEGGTLSDGGHSANPVLNWTGSAGGTMLNVQNCGFCQVNGFQWNANSANVCIDQYNTGSGRICTQNTFAYNFFNNTLSNASFVGIRTAVNASDNTANNEFHNFVQNTFEASGNNGIGIQHGNSSNSHAHLYDTNSFVGLNQGINATWLGIRMIGRNNFSNCSTSITFAQVSFPSDLGYMDMESCATAVNFGNCNSPVSVHHSRIAGLGNVAVGKGVFEFSGTDGPANIYENVIGNGNELAIGAFIYNFNTDGNTVNLRENVYGFRYTDATIVPSSAILNNWNNAGFSGVNHITVENERLFFETVAGQQFFPYINGKWQSPIVNSFGGGTVFGLSSNVGALGLSTEDSRWSTTNFSAGTLTIYFGVTHMNVAGTPTLSTIAIPPSFNWFAGQFIIIATKAFSIDNSGNIKLPSSPMSVAANTAVSFVWDGTNAYPL